MRRRDGSRYASAPLLGGSRPAYGCEEDGIDRDEYLARIEYELEVINGTGYTDYYLIVWDFIDIERIMVGPGRGSVPLRLSPTLFITDIDPPNTYHS